MTTQGTTRKKVVETTDGMQAVPEEEVEATVETTIVVCQCGHTHFKVKNKIKTAVTLECSKCSFATSVKGPIALARVDKKEVAHAVVDSVIRPDPDYDPGGGKPKGPTLAEQGYVMLRFRVLETSKNTTIDRAMEAIRIIQTGKKDYEEQTWQGHALEYLCADFLAGVNPQVLALVDEIADESIRLAAEAESAGKKKGAVKKKVREYRQKARVDGASEIGIDNSGTKPKKKDTPKPVPQKQSELDIAGATGELRMENDDERVHDAGNLSRIVREALTAYAAEHKDATNEQIGLLMDVPFVQAAKRAEDGGFLIRVIGDDRTVDKSGARPTVYCWIEYEPDNIVLELDMDYSEVFGDALDTEAELFTTEMLPTGYKKLKKNERWDKPTFCDNREEIKVK